MGEQGRGGGRVQPFPKRKVKRKKKMKNNKKEIGKKEPAVKKERFDI